ncbi:MAG: 3-hexulose-6-phosphate synthase [Spirochaetales bacterium]|nr:MAG: 3-hexulose-6-phosphate synthase [Spirochaetales bacterium]
MVNKPLLQLAVDAADLKAAMRIAGEAHPFFDILELGTPLVIEEGMHAFKEAKLRFPSRRILVDAKIADAGYLEAYTVLSKGADIVTVLGVADDKTIEGAVRAARETGGKVMADLIHVTSVVERARRMDALGVDIVCLHTASDCQSADTQPLAELEAVRPVVQCLVAIAGGMELKSAREAAALGADIVVVSGGIIAQKDIKRAASKIYKALHGRAG